MATRTFNTRLSRRAILAGGLATPALAFPTFNAIDTLPVPTLPDLDPNADAELFRRIATAEQFRNRNARARRLLKRLRAAGRRSDLMPSPLRDTHANAWLECWKSFEGYAKAVREAVAVPARTVAGVHAKLSLGAIATRQDAARVYMYEDRAWLDAVLSDLERMADREQRL
ncbi:hypothetical protein [Hoeflea prorocentri]|uniref:Uncharacterized protein n=1 Tax=Hoeflea prorocentri TaxID=1922333 RepID=A0A9X3ZF66_9HYPH|nr:hypothetical protein [Hoeflea prorocentri]MCY6379346.1 hypothetical protein [Hoeflea prorocentri]MDA5397147.1 hypothetical protein [Hoeflea prorocentri]